MIDRTVEGSDAAPSSATAMPSHGLRWMAVLATAVLLLIWPLILSDAFVLHIATMVLFYCIGASSLHLVIRTGHISLAHAAFMGIGGYASVLLMMNAGWPFPLALLAGVIASGLAGLAIGPVLLRLTGKYFVLVTFLFGEIMRLAFTEWQTLTGGANGIFGVPRPAPLFESPLAYYYLALGAAAACVGICLRVLRSEIGRTMDALREGEQLAECSGVPVLRFKVIIFVIACAMVGVQGSLQSHFLHFVSPLNFGTIESLNFVVMNVIGGMNNLLGPLLGALFLVSLPELLREYVELQRVLYGVILIIVMAFLPGGLVEIGARARRLLAGRRDGSGG